MLVMDIPALMDVLDEACWLGRWYGLGWRCVGREPFSYRQD